MSGGGHGVSSEDRQRTAADPISTEVRRHEESCSHLVSDVVDVVFVLLLLLVLMLLQLLQVKSSYYSHRRLPLSHSANTDFLPATAYDVVVHHASLVIITRSCTQYSYARVYTACEHMPYSRVRRALAVYVLLTK